MVNLNEAKLEKLRLKDLTGRNIQAEILRLDSIHQIISGNKWFKLRYYLQEAIAGNYHSIATFGGAYSNHIIATACAASGLGLKSIGFIRGEPTPRLSHTLTDAKSFGMQLEFISRENYRKKMEPDFLETLKSHMPGCLFVPEGGAGSLGIKGSEDIAALSGENHHTHIICAVGTGTMLSGLANASKGQQKTIGICVLKGMQNLKASLAKNINPEKINQIDIIHDYHFGGYAKKNKELILFMNSFFRLTGVPTDFVYTGKLMYAVSDLLNKNYFPEGSRLLIIHSGGLQGNQSLPEGTLCF